MDWTIIARFFFVILVSACGSATPMPSEPASAPASTAPAEPPPPVMHTVSIAAAFPEATRTASGLGPDGSVYCRQTYFAAPPEDERHCIADGHGITARVLHGIDANAEPHVWLEAPLEIRRIRDCGNDETRIRRPRASLLSQLAPELASARPEVEVDLRSVQFASCPDASLKLRFEDSVELQARGSILRLVPSEGSSTVALLRDRDTIKEWVFPHDAAGLGLELEVLCNETFVIVAGGLATRALGTATTYETTLACVPSATGRASEWQSFERVRIDVRDGSVTPIVIDAPRYSPSTR